MSQSKTILWWGRSDVNYSRNRVIRCALQRLGWRCVDFSPRFCTLGHWEAGLRCLPQVDVVWVPCFRQRDVLAASKYARRHRLPLVFDPLISSYDKQVFERAKYPEGSARAEALRQSEEALFQLADSVVADTACHQKFFAETFRLDMSRTAVVYVGAEDTFVAAAVEKTPPAVPEVLFYGSFIGLQGPEVIIDAARRYQGPPVRWTLLGDGPLKGACAALAKGCASITFEPSVPYADLPARIQRADILLGVFGATAKTVRVIPNKVFQALACGKPVVTSCSAAYPERLPREAAGLELVPQADAHRLAQAVAALAGAPASLAVRGQSARAYYDRVFGLDRIVEQLSQALHV